MAVEIPTVSSVLYANKPFLITLIPTCAITVGLCVITMC